MYAVMRKLFFEIFHEFWSECFQISNKVWGNVSSVLKAERCMYKQISTAVFSGHFVALFFEFLENISSLPVEAHYLMMIYIYIPQQPPVSKEFCVVRFVNVFICEDIIVAWRMVLKVIVMITFDHELQITTSTQEIFFNIYWKP